MASNKIPASTANESLEVPLEAGAAWAHLQNICTIARRLCTTALRSDLHMATIHYICVTIVLFALFSLLFCPSATVFLN